MGIHEKCSECDCGPLPRVLHLHVKFKYFDQMQSGEKPFEYRAYNDRHLKMFSRDYDQVWIYRGDPSKDRHDLIRKCIWQGVPKVIEIKHEHFGDSIEKVFAIDITKTVPQAR